MRGLRLLISVALLVGAGPSAALAGVLRVGVSGSPPFVKHDSNRYGGISVEIWQDVSTRLNQPFEWVSQPNTKASLDALASGEIDIAVGPISITPERLADPRIDFTQPYFQAEEGLLLPVRAPGLWSRLSSFFGIAALSSGGVLIVLLFAVGNLIWLAERRRNSEQFPRSYLSGVGNGMWFALVTLTTVGYGDKSPQSRTGRSIAGIWMVMSLLTLSSITAGLASAFTIAFSELAPIEIESPDDLTNVRVAVVKGTTSESQAINFGAKVHGAEDLANAVAMLQRQEVKAVLFDAIQLRYHLQQNPSPNLRVAPFSISQKAYGFALPANSALRTAIDVELVNMLTGGRVKTLIDQGLQ